MKKLCVGSLAVLLLSSSVHAATITVEAWDPDPETSGQVDWSAGNAAFTHARNFRNSHTTDIVYSAAAGDGYGLTGSETFTFYTTDRVSGEREDFEKNSDGGGAGGFVGAGSQTDGGGSSPLEAAGGGSVMNGFFAGGTSTLTLSGLTANTDYELELYNPTGSSGATANLTFTNGIEPVTVENGVARNGVMITINYTTGLNTSVTLQAASSGGNWEWHALTNETLVSVPEPSTSVLAALGLLSLGLVGWRRRRRA